MNDIRIQKKQERSYLTKHHNQNTKAHERKDVNNRNKINKKEFTF